MERTTREKRKRKKRVEEIRHDEREKIREEEEGVRKYFLVFVGTITNGMETNNNSILNKQLQ